jgi:threonine dehydratase
VIKRGLLKSGRSDTLAIQLEDKPGQLVGVSKVIAELGGNVVSIHHERASEDSDITDCILRIVLETRDFEHIKEIRKALTDAGFKIVKR